MTGVIICAIAWWIANAIPSQPSKFDWLLSALICALLLVGFGLLGRIFGRLDSLGAYIRIAVAAVSLWGILSKLVLVISTEITPAIFAWFKQHFPTWMTWIITLYQEDIHPIIFGKILPDLPSYVDEILANFSVARSSSDSSALRFEVLAESYSLAPLSSCLHCPLVSSIRGSPSHS